jgi:predicted DNA-binding transcriptional regulator YafY
MTQSKTARWLDLLAYLLQHRFAVPREEIWAHVADYRDGLGEGEAASETVRRKFERDKDELRALGIEIETVPVTSPAGDEPSARYRLKERTFYLPYLELADSVAEGPRPYPGLARVPVTRADLSLLDRATRRLAGLDGFPLAAAAASARRKLEFDLPLPVKSVERVLSRPLEGDAAKALEVLQRAVAAQLAVRCRYFAIGRDAEERRVIEPYGLFFSWGRWYTAARARDRDAVRVFRVDRMTDAELLTGADARFAVPPGFSVRRYIRRSPWELTDHPPTAARVRFSFPESRWVLAQGVGAPVEPVLEDGGAVLDFEVREPGSFLRWLLTFRDHAAVLAPASMAAELTSLRSRVARLYAGRAR